MDFRVDDTFLTRVAFAVFGLGSSLYDQHFNAVAKRVSDTYALAALVLAASVLAAGLPPQSHRVTRRPSCACMCVRLAVWRMFHSVVVPAPRSVGRLSLVRSGRVRRQHGTHRPGHTGDRLDRVEGQPTTASSCKPNSSTARVPTAGRTTEKEQNRETAAREGARGEGGGGGGGTGAAGWAGQSRAVQQCDGRRGARPSHGTAS